MVDLATVTEKLRENAAGADLNGKAVKLDFGGEGKIHIDGAGGSNVVTNEDKPADTTIAIGWEDFQSMAAGQLDPMMAFMQGKMKVVGDIMLAQKLTPMLKR